MSDQTKKIESVVLRIYSGMCAYKGDLRIRSISTAQSLTFQVTPHEFDCRKLIGKKGILYHSMLAILRAAAGRIWITTTTPPSQLKIYLEIEKSGDGHEEKQIPIDLNYDREKMMELIRDTCSLVFDDFALDRDDTSAKSIVQILVTEEVDDTLKMALDKIFWAYGKATGRLIQVEFSHVNHLPIAKAVVA